MTFKNTHCNIFLMVTQDMIIILLYKKQSYNKSSLWHAHLCTIYFIEICNVGLLVLITMNIKLALYMSSFFYLINKWKSQKISPNLKTIDFKFWILYEGGNCAVNTGNFIPQEDSLQRMSSVCTVRTLFRPSRKFVNSLYS
jgi:hypothetical protein